MNSSKINTTSVFRSRADLLARLVPTRTSSRFLARDDLSISSPGQKDAYQRQQGVQRGGRHAAATAIPGTTGPEQETFRTRCSTPISRHA